MSQVYQATDTKLGRQVALQDPAAKPCGVLCSLGTGLALIYRAAMRGIT